MSRAAYIPPIALDRLQAMILALESGAKIDRTTRKEIVDALDCLFITLIIEKRLRTSGRRAATMMRSAAYRVHCLVERHGAYVNSAVDAVLVPGADEKIAEALKKTYRKMKAEGAFGAYMGVNEERLARDAARLPLTRRKHKSGNK